MSVKRGVTENLKAAGQLKWVGLMNNIRHSAEKIFY
ncbi:MAG: TnpV protein [Clostridia bacterium]|nr:TnpV protein [Clostridia bacterium]